MDTNTVINFIEKAIEKTQCDQLIWSALLPDFFVKPIPGDLAGDILGLSLNTRDSYVAKYKDGNILLLVYEKPNDISPKMSPTDNSVLSLRMQDERNKFAFEITNSTFDVVDHTQLIRLYNVINLRPVSVCALVDDFLNWE